MGIAVMKQVRWQHASVRLVVGLVGAALALTGCPEDKDETPEPDVDGGACGAGSACSSDDDCPGPMQCVDDGAGCACACPAGSACEVDSDCAGGGSCVDCACVDACPAGSECSRDDDCSAPMACEGCACSCPLDSQCFDDAGCGADETCVLCACAPTAREIPPNTTNCAVDADGCLVGGVAFCNAQLEALLAGLTGAIRIDGVLLDNVNWAAINIFAFGETNGYEFSGYKCQVSRSDTTAERSLAAVDTMQQGSDSWAIEAGEYPVSVTCTFDGEATSASVAVIANGANPDALESTTMGTPRSSVVAVEVLNAKLCNLVVTEP